jgi:hypothetical protein
MASELSKPQHTIRNCSVLLFNSVRFHGGAILADQLDQQCDIGR